MQLTKNFSKSEFECKCGCEMPKELIPNIQKLANQLQVIRDAVNLPIKINSAYRCPEHNTRVGGVKTSMHLHAKASDIVIKGYSNDDVADLIEQLIASGDILQGGLGRYNTFTHYDIRRGGKSRWNFKN
jgi:uncharacterized protein YcbK (DUF882 family)